MDEDNLDFIDTSKGMIKPKSVATLYEFYICGAIEEPNHYIEMFDTIRHSRANDTIKIYLNSFGGDMFTGIQFLRVLSEAEGEVIVSIEGACMSAATLLMLAADSVEITPNSSVMVHNYSSGTFGKGNEMHLQIQHERKWSENLFKQVYADFLTEEEIKSVLDGKDLWMDSEETLLRLEERSEIMNEKLEKAKVM
jgi:ATP-dependent protease ClpP protease subunit